MAYFNPHADALCSEDIDALRQVFETFCEKHQTTGSDADMQILCCRYRPALPKR